MSESNAVTSVIETLKGMTALELAELKNQIEDVFGVTAAVAAAPAGPAEAAPVEEEKTAFNVDLKEIGANKIQVIKAGRAIRAGQHRRVRGARGHARAHLVSEQRQRLHRRSDETQTGLFASLGKVGVLSEETVAGVDRVATRGQRRLHNPCSIEIGGHAQPLQHDRRVGLVDVKRVGVVLGVDGNGRDAQVGGRADHANRDLTAIRD